MQARSEPAIAVWTSTGTRLEVTDSIEGQLPKTRRVVSAVYARKAVKMLAPYRQFNARSEEPYTQPKVQQ